MRAALTLGAFRRTGRRPSSGRLALPFVLGLAAAAVALAYVVYVLWPRWPDMPVAFDATPMPIVVGDVVFRLPPAAIRMKVQRHPGTQDRVDLAFLWPALTPGIVAAKDDTAALGPIFVTIAVVAANALPPAERLRTIYPRYAEPTPASGPNGLVTVAFRSGSPYQGEDLLFDASAPDRFIVRCSRDNGPTPGTCLSERFVGQADITVRFPRDWLADWRTLANGIDRMIARWQAPGG